MKVFAVFLQLVLSNFKNFCLFLAELSLCCCTCGASSSWGKWGLLLNRGAWASHGRGFSCSRAWAYSPRGMWDLSRSGIKLVFLALAGRFLTTGPPGKSSSVFLVPNFFFFNKNDQGIQSDLVLWIFVKMFLWGYIKSAKPILFLFVLLLCNFACSCLRHTGKIHSILSWLLTSHQKKPGVAGNVLPYQQTPALPFVFPLLW